MKLEQKVITHPVLYLTLACYVGEATLKVLGIPIDITASVMYVLTAVALVLLLPINKFYKIQNFDIVSMFYIYLIIRNLTFNIEVIEDYWLPNAITFLIVILLCKCQICKEQFTVFLKVSYYFLSTLMLMGIIKALIYDGRLGVIGGPNGFYKFAMLFHVLSFAQYLFKKKFIFAVCMFIGCILAILSGSRGAIVTIMIILPLEVIVYLKSQHRIHDVFSKLGKLLCLTVVVSLMMSYFINNNQSLSNTYNRGIAIFNSKVSELTSVNARIRLLYLSIDYFVENPVIGMGARHMYYDTLNTEYPQAYAHNVFFEMLGEQGIIGFVLFVAIVLAVLNRVMKFGLHNIYMMSFFLGFLVYLIGAQFSGNILDTKMAIIFAELIIVFCDNYTRHVKKINFERYLL